MTEAKSTIIWGLPLMIYGTCSAVSHTNYIGWDLFNRVEVEAKVGAQLRSYSVVVVGMLVSLC